MHSWKHSLRGAAAICISVVLAGCGGGGGSPAADTSTAVNIQGLDANTTPPSGQSEAGGTPQAGTAAPQTRPDVATASMDEIAAWNAACQGDACRILLPERSGRSLTWWGTDPRLMEQVNESCGPQPDCRVPDGDLLVWNFDCAPQPTCRIRLSRAY